MIATKEPQQPQPQQAVRPAELIVPSPPFEAQHVQILEALLDKPLSTALDAIKGGSLLAREIVLSINRSFTGESKEGVEQSWKREEDWKRQVRTRIAELKKWLEDCEFDLTFRDLFEYRSKLTPLLHKYARQDIGDVAAVLEQLKIPNRLFVLYQFIHKLSPAELTNLFIWLEGQLSQLPILADAKKQIEHLKKRADTDPLTQLLNRLGLMSWIVQRAVSRAFEADASKKEGKEYQPKKMLLVQFDVDYFRAYNNKLEHSAGDAILKILAAILKKTFRLEDGIVRYGGEEFWILIELDAQSLQPKKGQTEEEAIFEMLQKKFIAVNADFKEQVLALYGERIAEVVKQLEDPEEIKRLQMFSLSMGAQLSEWGAVFNDASYLAAIVAEGATRPTKDKIETVRQIIARNFSQKVEEQRGAAQQAPQTVQEVFKEEKTVDRAHIESIPIESILHDLTELEEMMVRKERVDKNGVSIEMRHELIVTTVFLKLYNQISHEGDQQLMQVAKNFRKTMAFQGKMYTLKEDSVS